MVMDQWSPVVGYGPVAVSPMDQWVVACIGLWINGTSAMVTGHWPASDGHWSWVDG